jgi:hypothetical protein
LRNLFNSTNTSEGNEAAKVFHESFAVLWWHQPFGVRTVAATVVEDARCAAASNKHSDKVRLRFFDVEFYTARVTDTGSGTPWITTPTFDRRGPPRDSVRSSLLRSPRTGPP